MAPTPGEKQASKQSEKASGSKPARRGRGKARVLPKKHGSEFVDTWGIKEKQRLLAGLKIFAPTSLHSLSRYVQTRTPEQVASQIASIRDFPTYLCQQTPKLEVPEESNEKKAPLELWLPVVRDLVGQEVKDLSENLSEVVRIIGRTEFPKETCGSNLNWQNIYQYISDLLGDRIHLQTLTDLESLVVLDVMHSMADTLRCSDTQEQRRLMNLKYHYFTADPLCYPEFSSRDKMVIMALNNDFSSVAKKDSTVSSSIASPSSVPTSSTVDMDEGDESRASSSSFSSASAVQSTAGECHVVASSSTTAMKEAERTVESLEGQASSSEMSHLTSTSGKSKTVKDCTGAGDETLSPEKEDHNVDEETVPEIPPSDTPWTVESGYCRPRYYTLNPFCIPAHLLDFKAKKM